jgi:hypothetical protein
MNQLFQKLTCLNSKLCTKRQTFSILTEKYIFNRAGFSYIWPVKLQKNVSFVHFNWQGDVILLGIKAKQFSYRILFTNIMILFEHIRWIAYL